MNVFSSSLRSMIAFLCAAVPLEVLILGCHSSPVLSSAKSGFGVDNGGDTITCVPDEVLRNSGGPYYEGVYTLDYFLTIDPRVGSQDDLNGGSWEDYHAKV